MARLTPEQRQQVQDRVQELRQQGKSEAEIRTAVAEMLRGWGVKVPGQGPAGRGKWLAQLTPEQRQQVTAKVKELREQGKTPQEIRAAIAEMLKGWGVEVPAPGGPGLGGGWLGQLTPEQRQQVTAKVKELREQGKTPQEIRAAIAEMFKGWGVEVPAPNGPGLGGGWLGQLTPEQRQQVTAKVKELREQGKTPQEIRAAIAEMLKGWGIEVPAPGGPGLGKGLLGQLTPEQQQQVVAKIKELREQGKTPQEIRAAIAEMLKGWGVEAPAPNGPGLGKGLLGQLTPEQRQQVTAKVKELREQGKTPQEIRAAIAEMLKGWGIEPPAAAAKPQPGRAQPVVPARGELLA